MTTPSLSPVGELVRRADPDRFLTALFAPPARREALLTLYAFNVELSRASAVTSEPMLAFIRLQWWREVVGGARKPHEVATPLAALLDDGTLDRAELLALIDAREAEAEPIATLEDWQGYLLASAGGLAVAAGRVLGAPGHAGLRLLGGAYGVAGLLRSVPALAARGRCMLPEDVLAAHGFTVEAVPTATGTALRPVLDTLAATGRDWMNAGRANPLPRMARAAGLCAVLAKRDLRRPGDPAPRGVFDRLAVFAAAV